MKGIVVFDSNFGNTQTIAERIASVLDVQAVSIKDIKPTELKDLGFLVVGSPIIGWKPSLRMLEFLSGLTKGQFSGTKVASFDTRVELFLHGDAAEKILKALKSAGGVEVMPSTGFHVKGKQGPLFEGELDKASDWADQIKRGL
jgi:flavodoxin